MADSRKGERKKCRLIHSTQMSVLIEHSSLQLLNIFTIDSFVEFDCCTTLGTASNMLLDLLIQFLRQINILLEWYAQFKRHEDFYALPYTPRCWSSQTRKQNTLLHIAIRK